MTTKSKYVSLGLLLSGFLLATTTAHAQTWTTIASACSPGSSDTGEYAYDVATFEFASTATGQIKTRCNVVNPSDAGVPNWSTMTVGYVDPDGTGIDYQVDVQLARTSKSTGVSTIIKTFDSSSYSPTGPTSRSVKFTHTFDFTKYAYYVSLQVTRGDTAANPGVWFVSLQ